MQRCFLRVRWHTFQTRCLFSTLATQVATLESCRAGLITELHELQEKLSTLTASVKTAETLSGGSTYRLNLEEDKATVMWVRLVRDLAAGPVDIFLCATVDVTVQELKLKVRARG